MSLTNDLDVVVDDELTRLGRLAISARLGGQINNDAAGLHDVEHVHLDELGRGACRESGPW